MRSDGPTEDEWYQITDSIWQHAACLLENNDIYDDKTGFKDEGFKTEASNLFRLLTGSQKFDTLDKAHQGNALALLSGTFYALKLFTSHLLPERFDFWNVAELAELAELA